MFQACTSWLWIRTWHKVIIALCVRSLFCTYVIKIVLRTQIKLHNIIWQYGFLYTFPLIMNYIWHHWLISMSNMRDSLRITTWAGEYTSSSLEDSCNNDFSSSFTCWLLTQSSNFTPYFLLIEIKTWKAAIPMKTNSERPTDTKLRKWLNLKTDFGTSKPKIEQKKNSYAVFHLFLYFFASAHL